MIMEFNITAGIFHPFATSVILDKTSKLAVRKERNVLFKRCTQHILSTVYMTSETCSSQKVKNRL